MVVKKEVTSVKAFEYLKQQLSSGKFLSKILNKWNLESGKIYAFIPENISEKQLYNFEFGGLYPSEKKYVNGQWLSKVINEAKPKVKELIKNYINTGYSNYCVFEECNSAPNDPWMTNSKIEYSYIENDVYYFFDRNHNDDKKFERALNTSSGWYFLCVLSSLVLEDHNKLVPFSEISPTLMNTVAKNVNTFFVDAYDKEGYLMWEKNDD